MESHDDNSLERSRQLTEQGNIASALEVSAGSRRSAPRCAFTPSVISIVRGLADQGKSASDIAEVIGSTPASVRVKCSQFKIKLRRRRHEQRQIEWRKLVIYLGNADYAALNWKAADMQKSAVELSADLLKAIIESNIYEAVLDDDGS